jgi:hypothetical protein
MPLALTVTLAVLAVVVLVAAAGYMADKSAEPEERDERASNQR